MPENQHSYVIWKLVNDQVRVGPRGAFALDLGAVTIVLERCISADDLEWELTKMRALYKEVFGKKKKE